MQRNLRPPLLTSMNFIGVRHFEQAGGGGFLGMRYWTLVWRTKRVNSAERQREPEADELGYTTKSPARGRAGLFVLNAPTSMFDPPYSWGR